MAWMIVGLVLFIAVHSIRLAAPGWRQAQVDRLGRNVWRGVFSVVSLTAFVLIVWGFGQARSTPEWIWVPPAGMRHLTILLMLVSFILFAAAKVPGNRIKAKLGHPMLAGVKTWAFAHLLSNGTLAHIILFGAFLAWAVVGFVVLRKRDRADGVTYPVKGIGADVATVIGGALVFAVFAHWAHAWLIGVSPIG